MVPLVLLASLLAAPPLVFATGDALQNGGVEADRLPPAKRDTGIVRFPVRAMRAPSLPMLRNRQTEVAVESQRLGTRYGIDLQIGTPGQNVTLIIDTGSPDLWVNPTCRNTNDPRDCSQFPRYDPSKSTSLNATNFRDILLYGSGNATIQFVRETVTFGSVSIQSQIIGVAIETHSIPLGILGLSPAVGGSNEYPYLLDTMVDQGVIDSRAFSLDLRTIDSTEGAVIFGGVDTGKYIGRLAKLPILPTSQTPLGADRYYVNMTGVGFTLPDGSAQRSQPISVPVFLDSGGTLSRLPTNIFQAIGEAFADALLDPETGWYFISCDIGEVEGSVDFYFGDKVIRVPFRDFVWQVQDFCILGVVPDDDGEPVLGDTFLRAAYVVFDQDNRNLHLAQAANCGSNLVAISSGTDAVPSVTGRCSNTPTATGGVGTISGSRRPTGVLSNAPEITEGGFGPGPVATRVTTTGTLPTSSNVAVRGAGMGVGSGAAVALGVVNAFAWML